MRPFDSRHVLLGVTGGIACYKAVTLARRLTQAGATVDVILTRAATEFVGPVTFEAVTGRPVYRSLIAPGHALDHIRLARAADAVVVAPATADFLARAAHGRADDLLTACLLAADGPVLIAPAMNDRMWAHPQVRRNVTHLCDLGYHVVDPESGPLAVDEGSGPGRLPEPEVLIEHIGRLLETPDRLAGRRIVVTAGPTREAVDPVRFISNHSSGRMGVAIAAAAWRRHARVTLIHGPLSVPLPPGVTTIAVESTQEMCDEVRRALADADALVMAAAPADYRPAAPARSKLKKNDARSALELEPTPDILLGTRDARRPGAVMVGFALETDDPVAHGREKLRRKALDLVVVNDATESGAGFGVDTNRVTILDRDGGETALPLLSKRNVAEEILDRLEARLAPADG